MRWMLMAIVATVLSTPAGGGDTGSIVVTIDGLRNAKGSARVALFNREPGFPDEEPAAYRTFVAEIVGAQVLVRFEQLPSGTYAVAMYHDENGDAKFNKGLFGIPKEGYGVSNNIVHAVRAPKFSEAVIPVSDGVKEIAIRVHY